ncbi:MAG TPA: ATP-binding protein [Thermodesulfovibrionales bacterium]|nr:ATP-binding protein [Thermodesulfovibrionales bacterium]
MLDVPYEKLHFFREKLGISEDTFSALSPFQDIFIRSKDDFADYLYAFFDKIPETEMFLKHYEVPGFLRKAWANWFESLFRSAPDDSFLGFLWRIGLKHVEVNLDQRYTNLGFSIARQFCEHIIISEIPADRAQQVSSVINRLMDFCILVETHAYVAAHFGCNVEIVRGVADRVRNKITTIGGTINRLKRNINPKDPAYGVYETLISESAVCERMVADTRTFVEMSVRQPEIGPIDLEVLIAKVLDDLLRSDKFRSISTEIALEKAASVILGDIGEVEAMFHQLLLNGLEAADPGNPQLKISSRTDAVLPNRVQIEIFNTGLAIKKEETETLLAPFFSTKFYGTGFGLPIAELAARKNYGKMKLVSLPGKGTTVIVTLPSIAVP